MTSEDLEKLDAAFAQLLDEERESDDTEIAAKQIIPIDYSGVRTTRRRVALKSKATNSEEGETTEMSTVTELESLKRQLDKMYLEASEKLNTKIAAAKASEANEEEAANKTVRQIAKDHGTAAAIVAIRRKPRTVGQ